jgi:hypothetical protein
MAAWMWLWAWGAAIASAEEPCRASTADLQARLEEAETRYANLDIDGFKQSTDAAAALLPCLAEPMPRRLAANYHRFQGLRGFVDGDPGHSTTSFAAARAIEPAYTFPEVLVPKGNPVLVEYAVIDVEKGRYEEVAANLRGQVIFDGRESNQRPLSWPTIAQRVDEGGAVGATVLLRPADPMPWAEAAPVELPEGPKVEGAGPNKAMLAAGGGAIVLSGAFYGLGYGARQSWADPATPTGELDALRSRVNAMQTANLVSGVLGLGLVGASFAF